jgi:TonB family protein
MMFDAHARPAGLIRPALTAVVLFATACASSRQTPSVSLPPCAGVTADGDSAALVPRQVETPEDTRILNVRAIQRALSQEYGPLVRASGPTPQGRAMVRMLISPSGDVIDALIEQSTGSQELDQAALRVARRYRWEPVVENGCTVPAWVEVPISFAVR